MKKFCSIFGLLLIAETSFSQSIEAEKTENGVPANAEISAAVPEEKFLVFDGKFFGEIFVSSNAEIEEIRVAEDFANWLERVCGTGKIKVRVEKFASEKALSGIFFGNTNAAKRAKISVPAGEEAFAIVPEGNAIFVVAKNSTALWHAETRFLREFLGVEFIFPGVSGAEFLPKKNVAFPRQKIEFSPPWHFRSVSLGGGNDNSEWARRLGFGFRPSFSHNLGAIFSEKTYEKFPSLRPICRGKLKFKSQAQPNLSDANAVPEALLAAKRFFEKNPQAPFFSLGINDSVAWDESENSEKLYGAPLKFFRNLPDRSKYFWKFVNRVAAAFSAGTGEKFRDKKIGAIAYLDVQNAPSFQISKNVVPVLCADRSMWVFPEFREDDKNLMRRWAASGAEFWGVYDYFYGLPFLSPRIFFEAQIDFLKFAHANGARVFYAEIFPIVPFDAPKIWLLSQLLENPEADGNAVLKRFYELSYGNAASEMEEFFSLCEKIWKEQGGQVRWIKAWRNENSAEFFSEKDLENLAEILKRARERFSDVPEDARERRIVERIEAASRHLARAQAFAKSYFERKKMLSAELESAEEISEILQSPAWNFEKIYDEAAFSSPEFSKNSLPVSDPRATVFVRIVEALKSLPKSAERSRAENLLSQLVSNEKNHFEKISEISPRKLIPALSGAPIFAENFEDERARSAENGEFEAISKFVPELAIDWRSGGNVSSLKNWRGVFAPWENAFVGKSSDAHSGVSALKISGKCETAEFQRRVFFSKKSATGTAVSIWIKGRISVGASAALSVTWLDSRGNELLKRRAFVPAGNDFSWRKFVVA